MHGKFSRGASERVTGRGKHDISSGTSLSNVARHWPRSGRHRRVRPARHLTYPPTHQLDAYEEEYFAYSVIGDSTMCGACVCSKCLLDFVIDHAGGDCYHTFLDARFAPLLAHAPLKVAESTLRAAVIQAKL